MVFGSFVFLQKQTFLTDGDGPSHGFLQSFGVSIEEEEPSASIMISLEELTGLCAYAGGSSRAVDTIGVLSLLSGDMKTLGSVLGLNLISGLGTTGIKMSRTLAAGTSAKDPKGIQRALATAVRQMQSAVDSAFKRRKMSSTALGRNSYVAGLACVSAHLVENGALRFVSGLRSVAHRKDLSAQIAAQEEEVEQWSEKLMMRLPQSERAPLMTSGKLDRAKYPHRELSEIAKAEQNALKESGGALTIVGERGCKKFIELSGCSRYVIIFGMSHAELMTELAGLGRETVLATSRRKPLNPTLNLNGARVLLSQAAVTEIESQSGFRFRVKTAQEVTVGELLAAAAGQAPPPSSSQPAEPESPEKMKLVDAFVNMDLGAGVPRLFCTSPGDWRSEELPEGGAEGAPGGIVVGLPLI